MKITILGSGPSGGVPGVGYGWGKTDKNNKKNQRLRPSVLVEDGDTSLLVDTSPDLRQQLLNARVRRLDAVLFTHFHADHLHGIDDLRPINRLMNAPLDCYADKETIAVIAKRFGYVFEPLADGADFYYKPTLNPTEVHDGETFRIKGIDITAIDQDHGYCRSFGFRFGDTMAYSTDVVEMPETSFERLAGVETWIIGTLTDFPAPTHADVDKALTWIERIGPKRAFLTHLGPNLDYDTLCRQLPDNVEPAYDGLVIDANDFSIKSGQ